MNRLRFLNYQRAKIPYKSKALRDNLAILQEKRINKPRQQKSDSMTSLTDLTQLMAALRHPETGCPWDIKQTSASIGPYTLEETYELLQAIDSGDTDNLREELGDLLFHIVFHAQIAREHHQFTIGDVVNTIVVKMKHRHPHVFAPKSNTSLNDHELKTQWQAQKMKEKKADTNDRLLDSVPLPLPALMRSQKLQDKAAEYYFDWPEINPVFDKLNEELAELHEAIHEQDIDHMKEEIGDILFACVNLARHLDIDAESALRQSNEKFIKRFDFVVKAMQKNGYKFDPEQLDQMEKFWQQSKRVTE